MMCMKTQAIGNLGGHKRWVVLGDAPPRTHLQRKGSVLSNAQAQAGGPGEGGPAHLGGPSSVALLR